MEIRSTQSTQTARGYQAAQEIDGAGLIATNLATRKAYEPTLNRAVDTLVSNAGQTSSTGSAQELSSLSGQAFELLSGLIEANVQNPLLKAEINETLSDLFGYFEGKVEDNVATTYRGIADRLDSIGIGEETLVRGLKTVHNWSNLSEGQRYIQGGQLGLKVLEDLGTINPEQSTLYSGITNTLGILASPTLSDQQKILGIGQIARESLADSFPEFAQSQSADLLVQAAGVVSSKASSSEKALALAGLGIEGAVANEIISAPQGTQIGALISTIQGVDQWSNMNDGQRIATVIQTSNSVLGALSKSGLGAAASSTIGAGLLSRLNGITAIAGGVHQAVDVLQTIKDLPRSQAVKLGAIGVGSAGAAIGAGISMGATLGSSVPVVGTIIGGVIGAGVGALAGAFGSGKGTAQKLRDGWRDAMEEGGFAKKIDGAHHVTLADGTLYNIGADGRGKFKNVDGTERPTFDVDWSNPITGNTVPDANLFAIATGLDPTSHQDHGLFHGAASQAWNAASSNASSELEVRANFKAMITKAGLGPNELSTRLELLKATNKITSEEHQVYLSRVNEMFGTKIAPMKSGEFQNILLQQLSAVESPGDEERRLLELFTNPEKYQESVQELEKRVKAS